MPPLVSIIIPAYQAERYVSAALESVLAQSYPHREIIVVDDGSTDGTPQILESFRRSQGIKLVTQRNRGQSAALNEGFRHARGDYIKYFDADDLLAPEMLSVQIAALAGAPRQVAYGEWGRFFSDPKTADFPPRPGGTSAPALEWLLDTWLNTEPMYQCALWLIPAELVRLAGGWDERLSLINDLEFFTRLVTRSQGVVFSPGARLYYRSGLRGSLSARKNRAALESAALSVQLAVEHVLAVENSSRTRRSAANILQSVVLSHYPAEMDLMRGLLKKIKDLGGSELAPEGGRMFRAVTRCLGWRASLRLRRAISGY